MMGLQPDLGYISEAGQPAWAWPGSGMGLSGTAVQPKEDDNIVVCIKSSHK